MCPLPQIKQKILQQVILNVFFSESTDVFDILIFKRIPIRCGRVVTDFDWEAKKKLLIPIS